MGSWDFVCALCSSSFDSIEVILDRIRFALKASDNNASESVTESERAEKMAFITQYYPESTLQWHEVLHALSYNAESPNMKKAYISGPGMAEDYGSIKVKRGKDPNAPGSAQNPNEMLQLHAYPLPEAANEMGLPLHAECLFNILPKVIGRLSTGFSGNWGIWTIGRIDKDVLWEAFQPTLDKYQSYTNLDHYERNKLKRDQYWHLEASDVSSVSNPVVIPSLQAYWEDLPRLQTAGPQIRAKTSNDTASNSFFFGKLSADLLLQLFDFLSIKDLCSTRIASRVAASVPLLPGYWKKRIRTDMPWVWELQSEENHSQEEGRIDWKAVYGRLHLDSFKQPRQGSKIPGQPGLWNRRRIWMTCEQIGTAYLSRVEEQARLEKVQGQDADLARCSFASHVPEVAWKISKSATSFTLPLILSWDEDIYDQSLVAYWSETGLLCGLEAISHNDLTSKTKCKIGHTSATKQSRMPLESSDWLQSLEISMSTPDLRKMRIDKDQNDKTGIIGLRVVLRSGKVLDLAPDPPTTCDRISKRLFTHGTGAIIVGIQGALEDIENGIVTRFGLLQAHPHSSEPPSNMQLERREKLSWLGSIPDPIFEPQQYDLGYWNPGISQDLIPREYLDFGSTSAERAHVTCLSIDDSLRRFNLHFDNKPSQSMGDDELWTYMNTKRQPRTKDFLIDGPGGERVIGIQLQVNPLPFELRIMTNRRRQAFFGEYWISRNGEDAAKPLLTAPFGKAIGGLYASFGYSSGRQLQLASISTLLVPDPDKSALTNPQITDMPVDSQGNFWDPCQPPPGWAEHGAIYGAQQAASHTVTWIDLSRPITRIEALQYSRLNNSPRPNSEHLRPYERVQRVRARPIIDYLKGLRIVYADGGVRTVAGAPADEPEDLASLDEEYGSYEDASRVDGWLSSRWDVSDRHDRGSGRRVRRVRVWSDEYDGPRDVGVFQKRGPSFGIRFEMEGVGWGPHFGDCFGEPLKEFAIEEEEREGGLKGLKVYVGLGGNGEHTTGEDYVCATGAQALVWS